MQNLLPAVSRISSLPTMKFAQITALADLLASRSVALSRCRQRSTPTRLWTHFRCTAASAGAVDAYEGE